MSGNFTFQSYKSLDVWFWCTFCLNSCNLLLRYHQANLNLCQGKVKEMSGNFVLSQMWELCSSPSISSYTLSTRVVLAGLLLFFPVHIQLYQVSSIWYQLVYSCCFQSISSCTLSTPVIPDGLLLLYLVHIQLYFVNSSCTSWYTPIVSHPYPVVPCQKLSQLVYSCFSSPAVFSSCQLQLYQQVYSCCFLSISSCTLSTPVVPAGPLLLFHVHIQLNLTNSSCTSWSSSIVSSPYPVVFCQLQFYQLVWSCCFPVHTQLNLVNSSCTSWSTLVVSSPYPVVLRQLKLFLLVHSRCFRSISSWTLPAPVVPAGPVHIQLYLVNSSCTS